MNNLEPMHRILIIILIGFLLIITFWLLNKTTSEPFTTSEEALENVSSLAAQGAYMVPGMIIMWHGDITKIPDGWALCDGKNGTPDLRDRFIIGAGNQFKKYGPGGIPAVDGKVSIKLSVNNLPNHYHPHTHSVPCYDSDGSDYTNPPMRTGGTDHPKSCTGTIKSGEGKCSECHNESINITPPYYALAFIMKK